VATAVAAARDAGLAVSLDLIYGAPGESLDDWRRSVEQAVSLGPDHVSAYALIIEEGTKLERQIRRGEVVAPDDDVQADMYELVDSTLAEAGYDWYEVSNWAREPSQRSRHNLAYWQGADWWGYGPGAHSHVGGLRWWNVKHPAAYAQRLAAGHSPAAGRERPDEAARRLESVLLRSRIAEGLPVSELTGEGRHGVASLIADGLIDGPSALHGRVVLTRRGRLLADAVVRALTV
ncbi:MAG: coproporphyrinogen III oxidase, partial [Microbacterium sp.]